MAVGDAAASTPEMKVLDDFANFAYTWVGRSGLRRKELMDLMLEFAEEPLVVLHIHGVRWLSCGQTMQRVLHCMPTFLDLFEENEAMWYHKLTSFQFQFLLHLLVDVLTKLNKLNKIFQADHIDVTQIGANLNICITMLRQRFITVGGAAFGRGSKFLWPFLEASGASREIIFPLLGGGQRTHVLHEGVICGRVGSIEECRIIGVEYVQRVVDALNERFPDIGVFNACKLFSPKLYPADNDERSRITEEWLERLLQKFQVLDQERDQCRGECLELVETMREMIPNKSFFEAWEFACTTPEWSTNWPALIKLWRKVLVIPASIAICGRGFSKQNLIKNCLRSSLKLVTLDALMRISCANILIENINWNAILILWRNMRDR